MSEMCAKWQQLVTNILYKANEKFPDLQSRWKTYILMCFLNYKSNEEYNLSISRTYAGIKTEKKLQNFVEYYYKKSIRQFHTWIKNT
jgi:hypothetical protein